jgi:hypothetical protein
MQIALHKNARSAVCAEMAASHELAHILAVRDGITGLTVCKWNKRDSVQDHSHAAHRLQMQRVLRRRSWS